jgi:hypothetical protein
MGLDRRPVKYTVHRLAIAQQTWASGVTAAINITTHNLNGRCEQIEVLVNNATNAITFTVAIASEDSGTLYSQAGIAENATTVYKATSDATDFDAFLVDGSVTITLTPSGDPGASGVTVDLALYLE